MATLNFPSTTSGIWKPPASAAGTCVAAGASVAVATGAAVAFEFYEHSKQDQFLSLASFKVVWTILPKNNFTK